MLPVPPLSSTIIISSFSSPSTSPVTSASPSSYGCPPYFLLSNAVTIWNSPALSFHIQTSPAPPLSSTTIICAFCAHTKQFIINVYSNNKSITFFMFPPCWLFNFSFCAYRIFKNLAFFTSYSSIYTLGL